jgi:hypothetical protein
VAVGAGDEAVGGAVVGGGGEERVEFFGDAHDDLGVAVADRVAQVAAALGPPGVGDGLVEFVGDQLGELVFEPFELLVGEGEVVGVGGDLERRPRGLRERRGAGPQGQDWAQ